MIDEYKLDLKRLSVTQIYRKHILDSECFALTRDQHLQLKEEICAKYRIEYNNVIVVGSAKLGFSIKPSRRYGCFNDESDIDVALVSKTLFENIWMEAFKYKKSRSFWPKEDEFFGYLSQGWIRPDKMPNTTGFPFSSEWWEFYRGLTNSGKFGNYKITAGVYYSHFFLNEYQAICISQCREEI